MEMNNIMRKLKGQTEIWTAIETTIKILGKYPTFPNSTLKLSPTS